jgi:hypothetical protein
MKDVKALQKKIAANIRECEQAEKRMAKTGNYTDAIKIQGMRDAYLRVKWDLDKILATLTPHPKTKS